MEAIVVIYLAKPIIDGFLEEIGADGARALKSNLLRVLRPQRKHSAMLTADTRPTDFARLMHLATLKSKTPAQKAELERLAFEMTEILPSLRLVLENGPHKVSFVITAFLSKKQRRRALDQLPAIIHVARGEGERREYIYDPVAGQWRERPISDRW